MYRINHQDHSFNCSQHHDPSLLTQQGQLSPRITRLQFNLTTAIMAGLANTAFPVEPKDFPQVESKASDGEPSTDAAKSIASC